LCRELGRARFVVVVVVVVVVGSRMSIQGGEWGKGLLLNNGE